MAFHRFVDRIAMKENLKPKRMKHENHHHLRTTIPRRKKKCWPTIRMRKNRILTILMNSMLATTGFI
jgi:hypothetical protein